MQDKGLICVPTLGGTMGDVRPLIALALALRALGFEILLIGNGAFEQGALRAGVKASEWFSASDVPQPFWQRTTPGQRWLWGHRPRLRDRLFRREIAKHRRARSESFWRMIGGPDNPRIVAVVASLSAWGMLRRFGPQCAKVVSGPMPYQPSARFTLDPPDLTRRERLEGWLRARVSTHSRRRFCEDLFHLVSTSPSIFPRPDDWLPNMQVTGYTPLEEDHPGWAPPAPLREFLTHSPPPVYVGFGSYPFLFGPRGERLAREIIEGCRRHHLPCIIQSSDLPPSLSAEDVFILDDDVPHAWLFPRCAAVVHHGGYGTVHSALLARRPMIIYPFQTDQFLWAMKMGELGVSQGFTARVRHLSASRLAADLPSAFTPRCQENAERLGDAVAADRGLSVQAAAIESIIEHTRRGRPPLEWRMPDGL